MEFKEFVDKIEKHSLSRDLFDRVTEMELRGICLEKIADYISGKEIEFENKLGWICISLVNAAFPGGELRRPDKLNKVYKSMDIVTLTQAMMYGNYLQAMKVAQYLASVRGKQIEEIFELAYENLENKNGHVIKGRYLSLDEMTYDQRRVVSNRESKDRYVRKNVKGA